MTMHLKPVNFCFIRHMSTDKALPPLRFQTFSARAWQPINLLHSTYLDRSR